MRQYFIKISLIFMAFLLSSCGGGTTTSSTSGKGNNELKIETKQALFNQEENLLNIDFLVKNNYNQKIDVSLKNLSVDVKPCNVRRVSMTPKNIHFSENITEQYVTASVELIGSCTPNSYKISSSKILTLDDKSNTISYKSEDMEINPDIAVPKDTNLTEAYKFFNIPAPLNIELPDTEYSFKIQLINGNFRGVSGQEVRVLTYDIRYGEIQNFVVTTDENGFANFLFKSAKDLSLLTGKKLSLTIIQGEEPSTISSTINLKFKDANAIPKNYQLQNPTSIVIQNAGESKNISVDIVNSLGIGESGKTVQITTIPGKFGAINTSRTVTNDAGRAIFKYTAPDSLDEINNKSVTVTMSFKDGDKELSETAKITIRKSLELDENEQAEEVEVLEVYSFQNATSITVVKRNQSKDISIDLVDSMGMGVAGETVKISNIPSSFGEFISATATTNEAGRATFHYKAPNNIDDINGKSAIVTLAYTNEQKRHITQEITIDIKKSQDAIFDDAYKFQNATSITVERNSQNKNISIDLVDSLGIGVAGKTLRITNLPSKFGLITSAKAITNDAGRATFFYTSPSNIDDIYGKETALTITFEEEDLFINEVINIAFNKSTEIISNQYKFRNPTSVLITSANENKDISIDLVNNSGIGVEGKDIQITTIASNFGSINSSTSTTNAAGRAIFKYTAPDSLDAIDGQSTSVTVSFKDEDTTITQTIKIRIKKTQDEILERYRFQNPTSITVGKGNQSKDISIDLVDSSGIGVAGKTIKITNIPSQMGTINTSKTSTNDAGRAIFNYLAPESLDDIDGDSTTVTLSFTDEDNTKITQEITITIKKSKGEVSDSYQFQNATSITIEKGNQSKDISIDLVDSSGIGLAGKTIKITNIPSQMGTINTSKTSTNDAGRAIFNYLAPESIDEIDGRSITVTLSFVDEDNTKITQNITIDIKKSQEKLSGPPSAISISYVSTGQDEATAKYIEKFAISVTDEYGNRINTRPYISIGAIVGYAVDGKESSANETNQTKRLFYGRKDIANREANGTITDDDNGNGKIFKDITSARLQVFKYVNSEGKNTDKLVVFGAGKNYEAMGKWDVIMDANKPNELSIEDNYFGKTRDKLYYAVGHNYYQDQCKDDGREWLGNTDSETYQLDEEGTVVVSYKYDYHLTGKDALIWVNLEGYQPYIPKDDNDTGEGKDTRIGEVLKHTLRGKGLESRPSEGYFVDKNSSITAKFDIHHKEAPEWYHNGHFAHDKVKNKCKSVTRIDSINLHDARSCNNDGVAYIQFEVNATEDKSCSFNINNILVSSEFKNINGEP